MTEPVSATKRKAAPPRRKTTAEGLTGRERSLANLEAHKFKPGHPKVGGRQKKPQSGRAVLLNTVEKIGELYGLAEEQRTAADILREMMKKSPDIVTKHMVSVLVPKPSHAAVVIDDFDLTDIPAALRRIAALIAEGEDVGSLRALSDVLEKIQQTQALQARIDAINSLVDPDESE